MADENVGLDLASQTGQENIKNAIDGLRTEGLANQEGQEAISSAVGLVASQLATALHGIVLKTTNASIGTLTVTENGTYDANDDADYDAYEEVVVDVPNTYETTDEGKVVSNGSLVSQSSQNVTENGTYDTTEKNEVVVSVPSGDATNVLYNPSFNINTTGQTSWDATNSGTYASSRVHILDGWDIMQLIAEDVSEGIKIIPKYSYAYLLQQIPLWFGGKQIEITATVNGTRYTITGVCPTSGGGVSINTPFGELYIYAYAYNDIVFTLSFVNQVNNEFIISETSLKLIV